MPDIHVNGARLHYEVQGEGPETIVFSHGLLWSGEMFAAQVAALKDRYRCITFDFRGQGRSEVTAAGYDIESLYEDALALLDALGCTPCHFAGLSMGGFVALRLGIRRPELLRSLILIETTADPEAPASARKYKLLNFVAGRFGLGLVAGQVMPVMFGQKFLKDPDRAAEKAAYRERMIGNDRTGITRAVEGVIAREGVHEQIDRITVPTLIIVGDQDMATLPEQSQRMHARISGSQLVVIPGAGHSSTMEEPAAVTAAIEAFLAGLEKQAAPEG